MAIKNRQSRAAQIQDTYPLSPLQQGMLIDALLNPGSGVDIVQLIGELHESLDVAAFQRAWRCVVARHPVLRTAFRWENLDEPRQQVQVEVELPWEERDWRGIEADERERRMADFLAADRRRGFDMARAPLLRLTMLRYGEAEFHLVVTNHHAVLDGGTRLLVLREVFAFYEAFRRDEEIALPVPRPYRDYIDWLQQQDFNKDEAFWRKTLKGFTAPTPLAVDHAPSAGQDETVDSGDQEVRLSTQITSALRTLAKDNQLTLNTIVQGAWALLLRRYSGEPDVVFGVVRANRRSTIEGAEAMIGLFINTLPLRVRVNLEAALLPWLSEVRGQWTAMRAHEHTPLVKLRAWSEVPPSNPLFDSIVIFDNHDIDTLLRTQGGPWAKRRFRTTQRPNFPLMLSAFDGFELVLRMTFHRRRIDDASVGRMLNHLRTLLEAFTVHPQWKLGEFSLLSIPERQQLLVEWNQTATSYPQDKCVHELFEEQVRRAPDGTALVHRDRQLTYAELNRRANQLAHKLRELGVGPEVLVGVCAERSLEMVVGLLGVLKAGGAYVPLDPAYPKERLAYMLGDAAPKVLLTQERLVEILPQHDNVVCLDRDWAQMEAYPGLELQRLSKPENLAYVIYTSGSTGTPKGVGNTVRGLCNRLSWFRERFAQGTEMVFAVKTNIGFVDSVTEILSGLVSGARLVLVEQEKALILDDLLTCIGKYGITHIVLVPSLLALLLKIDARDRMKSLRTIICSGESLPNDLVRGLHQLLPQVELFNFYGSSEVNGDSTFLDTRDFTADRYNSVIGRPIANTQIYILDRGLKPVPVGVIGELHIGGAGLARGYLNRPELTAEKFIANPFGEPGARLYKTGDLARYLPDGNIEYLGRTDHQVKLRGFRIELGEIESVLQQDAQVSQAVVMLREDSPGDKRLVAYVVGAEARVKQAAGLDVERLKQRLRAKLPEYMVPAHYVMLDALALTPSGKVDRKSLPNLKETDRALGPRSYVAPRDLLELSLATVWERLLEVPRVGITDNFFESGGDSLGVLQLISELEQATGIRIHPGMIFNTPTIAGLVASLGSESTKIHSLVVPLQPEGDEIPVFCLLGIDQYKHFAQSLGKDQPVFGVYVVEEEDLVNQAIIGGSTDISTEGLVDAYYRAIARVRPDGPYRLAGLSLGGILAMELASKMRKAGAAVDLVILLDAWLPHGRHRNWRKWLSSQAAEVMNGDASKILRRKLSGVRDKLAKRWLPFAMQKDSSNVDQGISARRTAFARVIRKWQARDPQFDFKVILFRALDRSNWASDVEFDADYGWRRYLSGPLTVIDVPGTHLSIMQVPNVALVSSATRQCLQSAPQALAPAARNRSVNQ